MSLDPSTQVTITGSNGDSVQAWDLWTPPGTPRESYGIKAGDNFGRRHLLCAWSDRFRLARLLLGGSTVVGGATQYTGPAAYPDVPNWICQKVDVYGDGTPSTAGTGTLAFERALCVCTYLPPDYDSTGTGELEIDFTSTGIAVPSAQPLFKFSSTGNPPVDPSQAPAIRITTCLVSQTIYNRAQLVPSVIRGLVDKTNSGSFFGLPAETVLFKGARSRKQFTTAGSLNWSLFLGFECHPVDGGWNMLPFPNTGTWTNYTYFNGNKQFPPASFAPLYT